MSGNKQPSAAEIRALLADLFQPRTWIYWVDFLGTMTIAYVAAVAYLNLPGFSFLRVACLLVAGVGLYRLALFMHEIVHFRRGEMVALKVAWNLLAGVPMLMPSFLYESHLVHHNANHYGTARDGEYLPLGVGGRWEIIKFLLQILFLPAFVFIRFLIITPISFLHPRLREFALQRMSSFVIDFSYRREIPPNAPRRAMAAMELACFLRAAVIPVSILLGWAPWTRMPALYSLAAVALGLNHLRTLVAHRYRSDGEVRSHADQLDDSINISGGMLTELFFPVGLRYHALHHWFPSIPYHNLGTAHQRCMQALPAGSAYHRATYRSAWQAFLDLWRSAGASQRREQATADISVTTAD